MLLLRHRGWQAAAASAQVAARWGQLGSARQGLLGSSGGMQRTEACASFGDDARLAPHAGSFGIEQEQ